MVNTTRSTLNTTGKSEDEKPRSFAWMLMGIGFFVHLIAFLLSFISFFAPFWYIELNTNYVIGLWGRCNNWELDCIWFYERDRAWEKSIPYWHVAAQIIYALGISTLFIALMTAVFQLIFRCCKTSFGLPSIIGILILVATALETLSITVFGIGAYRTFEVSINSWVGHFEWGFYIGIAALFPCALAGLIFIWGGVTWKREMRGYSMPNGY